MSSRQKPYTHADLSRLVCPRVVAVVGASATAGSFGARTLENLSAFGGTVYAVNPKYRYALGTQCFPTLADLPRTPDCVIVAVSAHYVAGVLQECASVGACGAIVYASGFAESGSDENKSAQAAITSIAQRTGLRVVGPNCVGLVNTRLKAGLHFMPGFSKARLVDGAVSIVSQSGALGYGVFQGMERGIGIGHLLTTGNSADVDVSDFISYLADDERTKVIVCLMEGVASGERFIAAAEHARDAGKPLFVYKMGVGRASSAAAKSHTGTLVGSPQAYRAAFDRVNAIAVDHLDGLLEMATFVARAGRPRKGAGVAVMATSGGAAIVGADKAEQYDVHLPALEAATEAALAPLVPQFGAIGNPADITAEVLRTPRNFVKCLDIFANDRSIDAVVVPLVFVNPISATLRTPLMSEVATRTAIPIVGVWMNDWLEGPGSEVLAGDSHASLFGSADRCFEAIRAWENWYASLEDSCVGRCDSPGLANIRADAESKTRELLASAPSRREGSIDEVTAKRMLATYGITCVREAVAKTADEAVAVADTIGYPVGMKIIAAEILHKADVGGVELGLTNRAAVRAGFDKLMKSVRRKAPRAIPNGVVIQQMAPHGVELVLGARIDPQFGPIVAVGLGGTLVELIRDSSVALAPVTAECAEAMLRRLKGYPLLNGYRGSASVNKLAVIEAIVQFSNFASDNRDWLCEVDLNPVICNDRYAVCVDAMIIVRT